MIKAALPETSARFDVPTVVCPLANAIASKISNCNNFVNNLDVKVFFYDNSTLPCEYTGSPFVDKDHGHITTGNLKIITSNALCKLSLKAQSTEKTAMIMKKLRKA